MAIKCKAFDTCKIKEHLKANAHVEMCEGGSTPFYLPGTKKMCPAYRIYCLDRTNHDPVGDKQL